MEDAIIPTHLDKLNGKTAANDVSGWIYKG